MRSTGNRFCHLKKIKNQYLELANFLMKDFCQILYMASLENVNFKKVKISLNYMFVFLESLKVDLYSLKRQSSEASHYPCTN